MDSITSNHINYPEIAQAIEKTRLHKPEFKDASDKEVLAHVIKEHSLDTETDVLPTVSQDLKSISVGQINQQGDDMLPEYAQNAPEESRRLVQALVRITFEKGLSHGLSLAKKQDPMVLDMYHDALSDKMIEHMRTQKLL